MIRYYATDDTMGDTSAADCERFRAWAREELAREYPDEQTEVLDESHLEQFETDNEARRDEIADFCSRLWDRCPWDWA